MQDFDYLKRSKEEISKCLNLFNSLNEKNASSLLFHMKNSMLYIVDFVAQKHVDLLTELGEIRGKLSEVFGSDFFETYFLIDNLSKKELKFMGKNNILVKGKSSLKLEKEYLRGLLSKIISYFNNIYSKVEESEL
ncbi:MAG: hypothetical protein PHT91_02295 [Candidatus Nanoarchaeia archaeon]|nr:hypothetical protein [Candidatus Nanoarchaeia archaeon]MDD5054169.1 hypothetical protein [Candidatus Nanoarchaeia archaeon]MDD5499684.1 hypothetical protein [Candidatus Nanoarchaeia archaeon]